MTQNRSGNKRSLYRYMYTEPDNIRPPTWENLLPIIEQKYCSNRYCIGRVLNAYRIASHVCVQYYYKTASSLQFFSLAMWWKRFHKPIIRFYNWFETLGFSSRTVIIQGSFVLIFRYRMSHSVVPHRSHSKAFRSIYLRFVVFLATTQLLVLARSSPPRSEYQ